MIRNITIAFLAISIPYILVGAEPSAFGAGDLNNPKPYGLTSSEEILLENKQNLRKVVVKTNNQANEVDSLRERIDGLQTIIESISSTSRNNKLILNELDKKNNENTRNSGEYDKRLTELIQANSKEIEKVNLLLSEISKLIDTINTTYVTKKEFNSLVGEVNKFKDLVAKELKDGSKSKKSSSSNMSSADIETKAKSLYDKKLYAEALEQYNDLIKKNYKPAQSHYMVGEIEYYRKNYSEAIAYFKKSATLYNKASYMPVLMLHTAISMDETGDKKNAKTFYEAVISSYPDSTSAKTAKNKLSLLK